jgi:hypothetical protein
MKNVIYILILLLSSSELFAELVRMPYAGVRPTGMGNAFLAISDDNNALWYNPAALARVKGLHFNLIDTAIGFDNEDTLGRMGNFVINNDVNNLMRPDQQFIKFNFRPTFITSNFGISFFNHLSSYTEFNNLTDLSANVDLYSFNDTGVNIGLAIPFGPYISFGLAARAMYRIGMDANFQVIDLLTLADVLSGADFLSIIYSNLRL